ncbi:hypothetical protein DesteDRAFT_0018 [Nitratidesulfovibrio termitidis HI1]|uniref:Uncharacterized protein n=2 Tax=Nitratidesulfovibrio termitidis TaxID=42252 RepID=W9E4C6_9BACT|nr:hypothetical protein DesteDRAFT_0018 [Nitratidesulfovibrio termitidis HI1]
MSRYCVEAVNMDMATDRISRFIPEGVAVTAEDAIMQVFYPGGQPANNLPFGSYRVTVYINNMRTVETSTYRFN